MAAFFLFMPTSLLHTFGVLIFTAAWLSNDHYRPWLNFHAETLALVGGGLLLLSLATNPANKQSLRIPEIGLIILAVALIPWIQWVAGISLFAGDALIVSLYLSALMASVLLGFNYSRVSEKPSPSDSLMPFFFCIFFVALLSGSIGLLQWLSLQQPLGMYVAQTDVGDRAMGNMGQPNQLATLLLMGIAALAWIYERKKIGELGLGIGTVFLTIVLVLTQSRTGVVSALAMAALLAWQTKKYKLRINLWHVAIWISLFLLLTNALPAIDHFLLNSATRDMSLVRDSGRLPIWQQVWSGLMKSPWVGYGWNQTPTAHAFGAIEHPGHLTYNYAHNVVLDLLAWNGIPVGIFLVLMCVYWIVSRFVHLKSFTAIYAFIILTPIVIHSLLEFPFAYAYFLVAAGFFVGVVEYFHPSRRTFAIKWPVLIFVTCAGFAVGARIIYEYTLVEKDFQIVRFENLRVGQTPAEYVAPENIIFLTQLASMLRAARLMPQPGMSEEDIELLRKTSLRFAYGSLSLRYALALGLNGQPDAASHQMKVLHGMYGDYYYEIAVAYLKNLQSEKFPELRHVATD